MYLHNIVSKSKSELIRKVYEVQKTLFTKNYWCNLVQENKEELQINLTDEDVSRMSKERFKVIVNKSVERRAVEYLNSIAMKHEKSMIIMSDSFT